MTKTTRGNQKREGLPTFSMKDGFTYRLTGKSTSISRAWLAFDEHGHVCGVHYMTRGSLTKRVATRVLSRRWPYASSVRGAKRVEGTDRE